MGMNPRTLRPSASGFNPRSISGLALWLDATDSSTLYTTDAGSVTAVSSPTEISGCVGWWDASDASTLFSDTGKTTLAANGVAVAAWASKTGSLTATQATSGARPVRNGSRLQFTALTSFMSVANAGSQFSTAGEVFVVFEPTSGTYELYSTRENSSYFRLSANAWSYFGFLSTDRVGGAVAGAPSSGQHIATQYTNATSQVVRVDGLQIYSGAPTNGFNAGTTHYIGGDGPQAIGQTGLGGFIAEVVAFNGVLSAANRARVEKYLADKWGISGVHAQATATNDPVGAWLDKSGNGRNATQATGTARPTRTTLVGRGAVNFDGTDDTLAYLQGLTSDDLTTFCVYRYDTLNGGIVYDATYSGDNTNAQYVNQIGFGNSIALQINSLGTIITRMDSIRSFVGYEGGRSSEAGAYSAGRLTIQAASASFGTSPSRYAAVDGASLAGTTRFNGSIWSTVSFGSRRNNITGPLAGSVFFDGQVCEFLAYSQNLSQSQCRRVEQYLAAKWGITLAPQVSNADAQDWINRVYANGGTVSATTAAAVNTFCNAIDAASLRDRFYRLNLFAGTGLNACLVPLYRGPTAGGTTYGNATDTNVNFVSGDYVETGASGGLKGNGSNKRLDTGVNGSELAAGNRHLSAYEILAATTDYSPSLLSGTALATMHAIGTWTTASGYRYRTHNTIGGSASGTAAAAMWLGSDTSTAASVLYKNGSSAGTTSGQSAGGSGNTTYQVLGHSSGEYSEARLGAYSIGPSMSASQVSSFYTAMQAFQIAIGRSV